MACAFSRIIGSKLNGFAYFLDGIFCTFIFYQLSLPVYGKNDESGRAKARARASKNGNNDETKSTTLVRLFRFFMTVKLVL